MGIHEVARELYGFISRPGGEHWYPTDYKSARGTIDLHVHGMRKGAAGGRQEAYALAKHASQAGMRALVLKDPRLGPSVQVAHALNDVLGEWGPANGVEPTRIVGSVVLGHATGGINPDFAAKAVEHGARVVWLPVGDAAHWIAWFKEVALDEARKEGLYLLDGDHLLPEVEEVLELVKERGVALSFGHLGKQEWFALADSCQSRGITRAFVDHPFAPAASLSAEELRELGQKGVTTNFTYWELSPYCGIPAQTMVDAIRRIGADWVTLSSDAGSELYPGSVESMRFHSAMLDVYAFSPEEQQKILWGNQMRLLGLEPPI